MRFNKFLDKMLDLEINNRQLVCMYLRWQASFLYLVKDRSNRFKLIEIRDISQVLNVEFRIDIAEWLECLNLSQWKWVARERKIASKENRFNLKRRE